MNIEKKTLVKQIPKVDMLFDQVKVHEFAKDYPKKILIKVIRNVLTNIRSKIISGSVVNLSEILSLENLINEVRKTVIIETTPNLCRVINATGVVVHTNLGRSILPEQAVSNMNIISERYSNLEYDLKTGKRGSRYNCVIDILCEISGAE